MLIFKISKRKVLKWTTGRFYQNTYRTPYQRIKTKRVPTGQQNRGKLTETLGRGGYVSR